MFLPCVCLYNSSESFPETPWQNSHYISLVSTNPLLKPIIYKRNDFLLDWSGFTRVLGKEVDPRTDKVLPQTYTEKKQHKEKETKFLIRIFRDGDNLGDSISPNPLYLSLLLNSEKYIKYSGCFPWKGGKHLPKTIISLDSFFSIHWESKVRLA